MIPARVRRSFGVDSSGAALIGVIVAAWEISARIVDTPNFPGFSAVLVAWASEWRLYGSELATTLWRAAAGFGLALALMLPLGIFIGRVRSIGEFIEPAIDLLRPIPPLAIVPIAMLFAGIGSAAKVLVVFYSASFPILLNAIDATRSTHPALVRMGRSIGLSPMQLMLRIDLPAALPQIAAGIRVSIAVALLVSVSAEMLLSTDGIGNLVSRSQEEFRIAQGLGAVLLIAIVSLIVNVVVQRAERHVLGWHYQRAAIARQG